MSKKWWILIGVTLTILIGLGIGFFAYKNQSSNESSTSGESKSILSNIPLLDSEVTYQDESGFSFKHQKSATLKDVTPDDEVYYSMITLTKDGKTLTLSVKDTTSKTIEDYIKSDKNMSGVTLLGATSLGGVASKQYVSDTRLFSIAIDQGVVYVIDGPKGDKFWEDVQNKILTTFKFALPETEVAPVPDNTVYEEEEVY